jgi:hypothetical protein
MKMKAKVLLLATLALLSTVPVQAAEAEPTLESLQAEVERLRSIVPGQAFAMTQVAYNFNNLWFAAQAGNWPLARFYLNETKVRLRWAMRVTPVRKIASGDIELTPLATALETTQIAALEQAVMDQDSAGFVAGYTALMHGCQGCHEAVEKPFLQLQIPTLPAEAMIRFTP